MSKYFSYFCSIILLVICTASAEEKNSQWNSTVDFLKMKNILIHQENIFNALNVLFQSRMQESRIKINQEAQNIYDTLNQKIFTSKKKINEELKEILRSNFLIANTDRSECYKIKIKTSKDSFNKSENCRTCLFNITSNFTIEVNKLKEKFLLFKQNVTLMKKETENCVENNINQTLKSEEIQCIEKISRNLTKLKLFDFQNLSLGTNKKTLQSSYIIEKFQKCNDCFEDQYFSSLIGKFSNCSKSIDIPIEKKQ